MTTATTSSCLICGQSLVSAEEVACADCGLDPICQVLDYAGEGSGVSPAVLSRRDFVPAGGVLYAAGTQFHSIYAVKSGSFKSIAQDVDGRERVLGFYFPGELIGADAMASGHYDTTVRALEASQVCDLHLHRLADSGRSIQVLQQAVIEMLGKEVAFSHQIAATLIKQNSEQRLASFLLSLSRRMEMRGFSGNHFSLSMSRSDIASHLGLARETISRLLTRFQQKGVIALRGKRLTLIDHQRLEAIALAL
jgi:CRP/FNR family transcriptional regulator